MGSGPVFTQDRAVLWPKLVPVNGGSSRAKFGAFFPPNGVEGSTFVLCIDPGT